MLWLLELMVRHVCTCCNSKRRHVQELAGNSGWKHKLQQEVQQQDALIQQLQQQLQAAAQQAQRTQQQHGLQILRTYRAAAAKSAEHLQDLKDRYFHAVPVGPAASPGLKRGLASVLKMQRHDIAAAYAEFQQVRGSIQSMPSMPSTPSSHNSSLRRGMWADNSQASIKQPWRQGSGQSLMVPEPTAASPDLTVSHNLHSFALRSINRSASSSPQRRGSPEQAFSPRQTPSHLSLSLRRHDTLEPTEGIVSSPHPIPAKRPHLSWLTLPQAEVGSTPLDLGPASDSNAAMPSDAHSGNAATDGQPQPNWQLPFLQQLVQFEACLLTALMGLLTQKPQKSNDENVSEDKTMGPERQQCWPKSASTDPATDTTGNLSCCVAL